MKICNLLSLSMFSKWNVASVIKHYIPVKFHSTVNALPEVIKEIKNKKKKHQLLRNTIITGGEKNYSKARQLYLHTRICCVMGEGARLLVRLRGFFFRIKKREGFESIVILLILYYVVSGNYSIGLCFEVFFALSWKTP